MKRSDGPLLVYGPQSTAYDFGRSHPLTPRRFGPSIDLLRSLGAEPGLAPEPAPDEDLLRCHSARYIAAVKRLSTDPWGPPEAGIGHGGDNPSFPEMHEAGAMVAGGSIRAMEAILRGDVEHAFHPGGGLHHAMRDRASGFCVYDDPALAIARARADGLRVLYVDLDTHHGDGVQELFLDDPGVLTVSFHESGRYLFPGTGFPNELGEGEAAGTSVNVPFEPFAGEETWLRAVETVLPDVAAAFGPDVVVSQHGCDSHAWDPLAHLRVTTTAMGAAARLVDRIAHRFAGGRWLSTGGGGYDAYRVVPRAWSHVWLAAAHREAPPETPVAWRDRWAVEAARYGQAALPATFDDPPNAGEPVDQQQRDAEDRSTARWLSIAEVVQPQLLVAARTRGWWSPFDVPVGDRAAAAPTGEATLITELEPAAIDRLRLAARVVPPADPAAGHAIVATALRSGDARASAAVVDDVIVGLAVVGARGPSERALVGVGVAPSFRRRGLGSRLVAAVADGVERATVTVAERDPFEPLPRRVRAAIARRLLERAGLSVRPAPPRIVGIDRDAQTAA